MSKSSDSFWSTKIKKNSELFAEWEAKLAAEGLPEHLSPLEAPRASKAKGGVRKQSRPRFSPAETELLSTISSYIKNDCTLTDRQKDVFYSYSSGLSTRQISSEIAIPQATVSYTIRKIKARYIQLLKQEIIKICNSEKKDM